MVRRLVGVALASPSILFFLVFALVGAGLFSYRQLDIEAYPNPVPPLVEVITQPQGWSAEEVERLITIPLEAELAGMPGLDHLRSQSLFGLSDVKCYFNWSTTYRESRQEVINRLQFVNLPSGVQAQLSPWNAIGEVFRYIVRGPGYSLRDLKAAEDWILEREFKKVPGVVDVTSYGGETRQIHVDVDPYRLRGQHVTLTQLSAAIANANQNVGGERLRLGEQSYTVRGVGLFNSLRDIGRVVVQSVGGVPVRVSDVAAVVEGARPRLGIVGHDREPDVVQGIVLMRYGGETKPTLEGIYQRIALIRENHLLPPGMDIEPYYDRGALVKVTTHTVMENLVLGMVLVSGVLLLFLGNTRGALIAALNIPLSLFVAFCGLVATGTPANLISLGAIDFGIIVDSTVIVVENIFRHLGSHGFGSMRERVLAAVGEIGAPLGFSRVIIAVTFLPLFTMTGVAGVIFAPMAHTYAYAIVGAAILALTLTPVLAARYVPVHAQETENALMRGLQRLYRPTFDFCLRHPRLLLGGALLPILLCVVLFGAIGRELMPKLEEGNFWIRATLPNSISLEQSSRYVGRIREILRGHPEVVTVVSQLGRPDDGTDVAGFNNIELFAPLRPFETWPHGLDKEGLTEQLEKEFEREFPGVVFSFSQMISDNVEEAVSGVKGENSVKVVGPDLRGNERSGLEVSAVLSGVPGVHEVGLISSLGQPSVSIVADRERAARYGLNTGDIEAVIQAAVGGQVVTELFEGDQRFEVVLRWLPAYRRDVDAIRRITVPTPDGGQIPLGEIAAIHEEDGPSVIYREDGWRYSPVKFSVRGRDLAGAIEAASNRVRRQVRLPYGSHLEWAGEINELKRAEGRLLVVVPICLVLISFLVYAAVKEWVYAAVVLLTIPLAWAGGLGALLVSGVNFSVSAAMGFVSLFGIAIQGAILITNYAQQRWAHGASVEEGARSAAEDRFRPVLMTNLVAMLGLLPAALSHGIGAQTQKPLAVVVIGGSFVLALTIRILLPPLVVFARRHQDRRAQRSGPPSRRPRRFSLRRPRLLALVVLFAAGTARASADPASIAGAALDEEQAVALALAHNPTLRAAQQAVASTQAGETTAALRPNPTFSSGTVDFTAGLAWPLERGGKRTRRVESARLATAGAERDAEEARRQTVLAVRSAFTAALLAVSNLTLARDNLANFAEVEQVNRLRSERGEISGGDLVRITLQKFQFESDVADAGLALATAKANLRQELNAPEVAGDFELAGELSVSPDERTGEDLRPVAEANRPDLRSARAAREKAAADAKLAQANAAVDVTLSAGVIHTGTSLGGDRFEPFYSSGPAHNTIGAGLSVPLPLFDRNQGEIARTRSEIQRADEQVAVVRAQVDNDVDVAVAALAASRAKVRLYEETYLASAHDARAIAEFAYRRGATSILDLLDAERTTRGVELNYRQALADYRNRLDQLHAALADTVGLAAAPPLR